MEPFYNNIAFFFCLWRRRLPSDVSARRHYRDQNNHWRTIGNGTFWLMTGSGFVLARKCVWARFMLSFHWAFSYLHYFPVTTEARDPLPAWAKKWQGKSLWHWVWCMVLGRELRRMLPQSNFKDMKMLGEMPTKITLKGLIALRPTQVPSFIKMCRPL